MKRSIIARTLAVAAVALGLAPFVKADGRTCSNATIKGAFARTDTGFVIAPNGAAMPLAGVGVQNFDGHGRWTSTGYGSLNGTQMQVIGSGTYTVNADCTGHYEPDVAPPGRTGGAFFVIVNSGNEIQILPTDQGAAIICVARRVFPIGD